ncbi:MAG: hypothetical protein ACOC41_05870 [Chitinivibrionales bacterium]
MKAFLPILAVVSLTLGAVSSADAQKDERIHTGEFRSPLSVRLIDGDALARESKIMSPKGSDAALSTCGSMVYLNLNTPASTKKVLDIYSLSGHIIESHILEAGEKSFAIRCEGARAGSLYAVLRDPSCEEKKSDIVRMSPVTLGLSNVVN